MALQITHNCIGCTACIQACPCNAISLNPTCGASVVIEPSDCSHCWPFYQRPACVRVCPVNCIFVDPEHPVPPLPLVRRFLELILSVKGPETAAVLIARMRGWLHDWFRVAIHVGIEIVAVDEILDFYNSLHLIEAEYTLVGQGGPACPRAPGLPLRHPATPPTRAALTGIKGRSSTGSRWAPKTQIDLDG